MAVRECSPAHNKGSRGTQWKAYTVRSNLSPEMAENLVKKPSGRTASSIKRSQERQSKREKSDHDNGSVLVGPSTIYSVTISTHLEQLIRGAGANGIDLAVLAEKLFRDRKPVKNPRGSTQTAISALRRRGLPIYNTGPIYRMGAPVVLKAEAKDRALKRPNTVNQPLSSRELEIVGIFRKFAIDADDDVWLTASDLADEMKPSRNGVRTHRQHITPMIRNIVAKGFVIERKNAGFGNALMAYHFVGRRNS